MLITIRIIENAISYTAQREGIAFKNILLS